MLCCSCACLHGVHARVVRSSRLGACVQAHLDRRRGPIATLLVQAGTLRIGDMVVASASHGKVRVQSSLEKQQACVKAVVA